MVRGTIFPTQVDWVEVGRGGGEEEQFGSDRSDGFSDGGGFVAAEVIKDHNVTMAQDWHQNLHTIGSEYLAIDWPIDDPWGCDPVMAQRGDESHGVPVPERGFSDQALALCGPTAQRCHVGLGPCFVNEHKPLRIDSALMCLPAQALAGQIRAILLMSQSGFFLKLRPAPGANFHIVR